MKAYLIKTAETETVPEGLILADRKQIQSEFPVPSAFAKYKEVVL